MKKATIAFFVLLGVWALAGIIWWGIVTECDTSDPDVVVGFVSLSILMIACVLSPLSRWIFRLAILSSIIHFCLGAFYSFCAWCISRVEWPSGGIIMPLSKRLSLIVPLVLFGCVLPAAVFVLALHARKETKKQSVQPTDQDRLAGTRPASGLS